MKKLLVTISRQYGTSAQNIGKKLAEIYGINYYDNDNLAELMPAVGSSDRKGDGGNIGNGSAVNVLMSTNSFRYATRNEKMFNRQSKLMRELADHGNAVFVGRCADVVLAGYEGLVTVFLGAPLEVRIKNVMEREKVSEREAKSIIRRMDKDRDSYYHYYTDKNWGERGNYDICLDTSRLSEDALVSIIRSYIESIQ